MHKRLLIAAVLLLAFGGVSFAQGFRIGDSFPVSSSLSTPGVISTVSNAAIAICGATANAVPCTNKVATYTDATLVSPCSTATQVTLAGTTSCVANTDSRGNWGAWLPAGSYTFTITVSTGQSFGPYPVTLGVPAGSNLSLGNVIALGTFNAFGGFFCKSLEQTRCVDSTNSGSWAGSDIGAWVNAAYADLPTSSGNALGRIMVAPKPDGTCYVATTRISFGTNGKAAIVDFGGACIDYSASGLTSGNFITVDWGQAPGPNGVVQNLKLLGPCTTTACTAITANGIAVGTVNGAISALITNVSVGKQGAGKGFLNGWTFGTGLGYVNTMLNCYAFGNATGVNLPGGIEGVRFVGGSYSQNATGFNVTGAETMLSALSLDDNTTTGINATTGQIAGMQLHFENIGQGTSQYVTNSGADVRIINSQFNEDRTTGSSTQMVTASAGDTSVEYSDVFDSGRTITQFVLFSGAATGSVSVKLLGTGLTADYNHVGGQFVFARNISTGNFQTQSLNCRLDFTTVALTLNNASCIIHASVAAGGFTIQLPHAVVGSVWEITRTDTSANTLTIQADSGTINNAASVNFAISTTHLCHADGTNAWCN